MPIVEIDYCPRPSQQAIHDGLAARRFGAVVAHRRMGKSVAAVNHLIRAACLCRLQRPRFAFIAPTYTMGKQIIWDYLVHFTSPIPGVTPRVSELAVRLPNDSEVRIYGADNPDSLRGVYFDGVVFDEFGLMPPRIFSEVVRPALSDRRGWALFMGTPAGKNQFYDVCEQAKRSADWFFAIHRASETGLISADELASAKRDMTEDEYNQEYECSFEAAVKGSIYGKDIAIAEGDGRLTGVPYDASLPVDTDWDLGVGDATAIWFSQSTRGGEVRLIDYHEASGEGLPYYAKLLKDKGYLYGKHYAPHDIAVRELGSGKSRLETAAALGLRFEVTPRVHGMAGVEIEEGINAARLLLARCWFDVVKTKPGLEALKHYRRDYNTRLNEFKATPVHDWASHAADAFRGLAVRHQTPKAKRPMEAMGFAGAGAGSWMGA